jgi:sigma-B regulation protein RsbU (phosphoserine phosphatase)
MLRRLRSFIGESFQRKLLLFTLTLVIATTIFLFLFLMFNLRSMTDYSLDQNAAGMEQTVEDYLTKYAQEKSTSTWLQLKEAQDNLTVLGRTAQKIVDNYDEIRANPEILNLSIFQTPLTEQRGALSSSPGDRFETLIPPALVDSVEARELLSSTALLNLTMDAVFDANANNAFVYFIGNQAAPVTRAYPNIHLVEILQDNVNLLFWKDWFPQNVDNWRRWFNDPTLQERTPGPVTVEAPYQDAAGQGLMVTMFYPLWDKQANDFAGAVGADITLNQIVENVLTTRVAETGFAFLTNSQGEIIAMPEVGHKLFDVDLTETEVGGLTYYSGSLQDSANPRVQELAAAIVESPEGVHKVNLGDGTSQADEYLIAHASLPALSNAQYQDENWRIVVAAPSAEIFAVLNQTDRAINERSFNLSLLSLAFAIIGLGAAGYLSTRFADSVTHDLRTLAGAAEQVSAKNYDIALDLKSNDEIGQLGRTFESMTREIRDYTTNLETKVAERTADLQQANAEITRLNDQLKDENLRLSAELDVARRLQMMVLPPESDLDRVTDLDIASYMRPADEVGGDYYDVLHVGDTVLLGIGDVTGHGLPAGVVMLMAQTALLTLAEDGEEDTERILARLNRVLYQNIMRIRENKNMTLAILQYRNRQFKIVGQHESILVCRTDGQVEVIDTLNLGLPLGLEDEIDEFIAAERVQLAPGELLVLYTDGVTEAENPQRQQYDIPMLADAISRYRHLEAKEVLQRTLDDVYAFIDTAHIYDDISLVVVKQK